MGSFYERLLIEKPVNVILLSNAIHYAEENTVKIIMDNLLEHLNKDGIIIILEPERDAMFGDPKLNQPGELRDKKLKKINDIRSEIREYLENSTQKVKTSFFNHLTDKDGKIRTFMIVIKKN
jgi:accessory colonization factor AcfC